MPNGMYGGVRGRLISPYSIKNVTDVVTDNVTNKRTVTFRTTDKDGA